MVSTQTHTQLGWEMVYSLITQPASVLEGGSKSLDGIIHTITSVTHSLSLPISCTDHITALFSCGAVKLSFVSLSGVLNFILKEKN